MQLLEGEEYRYEVEVEHGAPIVVEPSEIFQPDALHGRTGRVRTGSYTGTLQVSVRGLTRSVEPFSVEVRSQKLNYLSEYQWMLRDIAAVMAEIVMNRFSASEQRFVPDETRDAATLYQQFAFLKSLVTSDTFEAALNNVLRRPHVSWAAVTEHRDPRRGIRATSDFSRQLGAPGPRTLWNGGRTAFLPTRMQATRTETTLDNAPNRFVKFVVARWRTVIAHILDVLQEGPNRIIAARARREAEPVLQVLDALLAEELFREVGALTRFPADDQVLQKREGYRDVYLAYVQFEAAAALRWEGGEDVYGAGQRDVATLYEYWVFIQLVHAMAELLEMPFDLRSLVQVEPDGLNVRIKRGSTTVLSGVATRLGRDLEVEFRYNPVYSTAPEEGSWTLAMRPDFSLKITPLAPASARSVPVLVHFDAKYRISTISDIFVDDATRGGAASSQSASTSNSRQEARREDLLKMHAYRDAIRRSVGAYIIYPGDERKIMYEYHELLPGLGAFALKPSSDGFPDGINVIRKFLEDVLQHVALQTSQHERGRYWQRRIFHKTDGTPTSPQVPVARFLSVPPADTRVLLGYVKSVAHWEWIQTCFLYNLRAYERRGAVGLDSQELACDVVVLSCPSIDRVALARITGGPMVLTAAQMDALDYPSPRGNYFCLPIEIHADSIWDKLLDCKKLEMLRAGRVTDVGAPVSMTWLELSSSMID